MGGRPGSVLLRSRGGRPSAGSWEHRDAAGSWEHRDAAGSWEHRDAEGAEGRGGDGERRRTTIALWSLPCGPPSDRFGWVPPFSILLPRRARPGTSGRSSARKPARGRMRSGRSGSWPPPGWRVTGRVRLRSRRICSWSRGGWASRDGARHHRRPGAGARAGPAPLQFLRVRLRVRVRVGVRESNVRVSRGGSGVPPRLSDTQPNADTQAESREIGHVTRTRTGTRAGVHQVRGPWEAVESELEFGGRGGRPRGPGAAPSLSSNPPNAPRRATFSGFTVSQAVKSPAQDHRPPALVD